MDLNLLYATTSAVNAVTSFVLGLFLFLRNPRSKLVQLWSWMSLAIAVWAAFLSISFGTAPHNYMVALFTVRFADMTAIFIPLLYLHFIVAFLECSDQRRILRVCYALSVALACFAFTPLYISGLRTKLGIINYNHGGPLFWCFWMLYFFEALYAIHLLWRARRTAVGIRRAHITYVMAAGIVGFLVGATLFPLCFDIPLPPIGGHVVWLYCLFVAWAVFKYQLFDIHMIIRRSLLISLLGGFLVAGYFGLIYAAEQLFKMGLLQHHILALSLTAITTFGLGLLVFLAEPKKRLNQIFGLYSLSIAWWAVTCIFVIDALNQSIASLWSYLNWTPTFFIAPTFLHTVLLLIGQRGKWANVILKTGYAASFLCLVLHVFFRAIEGPVRPVAYVHFYSGVSTIGLLAPVIFVSLVNIALWKLYHSFRASGGQRRTQLKYLFWASLIGYFGGSPSWFFCFGFHIPIVSPFGTYAVPLYSIATAYAVLHHNLFNVNLVIRKSLAYSILVTLLTIGYFGLIYLIERLFQTTLGYQSVWLSMAAFALMALAFQPLKIGIQWVVDWLLFRVPHEGLVKRLERYEQESRHTEKLKMIATLAAGMAHEIKNPLTSIKTFTEYLQEKADDPDFRAKFQRIVTKEVEKIDRIVRQMLDFAKPTPPQLQPVHVSQLLDETLDLLSNDCVKRRIKVDRSHDGSNGAIQADPQQLRQVFLNLLLNSLDAMDGQGGTLSVSTATQDHDLTVTIQDTGCGIPKEHLDRIFDPFFTTKSTGTGLGLSIVHSIITEHRGTITLDSQLHKGTCCMLTFPLDGTVS